MVVEDIKYYWQLDRKKFVISISSIRRSIMLVISFMKSHFYSLLFHNLYAIISLFGVG